MTFALRVYIQARVMKRFPLEDWLLVFAVIVLIADTVVYFVVLGKLYDATTVIFDGFGSSLLFQALQEIPDEAQEANAMSTFWWFIIFSVKLAYLIFFRKLVRRLKHLQRYWWFVTLFLVPAFVANEVAAWQTCPYKTITDLIGKCSGRIPSDRMVKVSIVTTTFDILTDIFIASIPICLLWRVHLAARQKLGLALTLCLSLVMAVFALVRIGGVKLPNGFADIVWLTFWQQQEANIAVTMVCMTAFRSFFIEGTSTRGGGGGGGHHRIMSPPWSSQSFQKGLQRCTCGLLGRQSVVCEETAYEQPVASDSNFSGGSNQPMVIRTQQPAIPSATITGMRTAIDGAGQTKIVSPVVSLT